MRTTMPRSSAAARPRRYAPVCYGHVGGVLGERLYRALALKRWLRPGAPDPEITPAGRRGLARLGVEVERLDASQRKPVNLCVERHAGRLYPHIGSHLSSLLVEALTRRGWFSQVGKDFVVTAGGRAGLARLGVKAG
jgi:hypothetical protein